MAKKVEQETASGGLRYVGSDPNHWLPGVPARDLTAEEADAFDRAALVASGFYEEVTHGQPNN